MLKVSQKQQTDKQTNKQRHADSQSVSQAKWLARQLNDQLIVTQQRQILTTTEAFKSHQVAYYFAESVTKTSSFEAHFLTE